MNIIKITSGFSPVKALNVWPYSLLKTTGTNDVLMLNVQTPDIEDALSKFRLHRDKQGTFIQVPDQNLMAKVLAMRPLDKNLITLWFVIRNGEQYTFMAGQNSQAVI